MDIFTPITLRGVGIARRITKKVHRLCGGEARKDSMKKNFGIRYHARGKVGFFSHLLFCWKARKRSKELIRIHRHGEIPTVEEWAKSIDTKG